MRNVNFHVVLRDIILGSAKYNSDLAWKEIGFLHGSNLRFERWPTLLHDFGKSQRTMGY
jgi:hypothetical protein